MCSRNTARIKVLRSRSSCVVLLLALVASSASAQTTSSTAGQCGRVHAVQSGDTCLNFANNYGLSLAALQSLNPGIACDNLQLGQRLCSAPCSSTYSFVPGDSCWAVGNQFGLNTSQLQALNAGLNCNLVQPGQTLCVGECSRAYSVVAGDFCFSIASQAGLSPDQLLAINPRLNCGALFPDQALCISTCSRKYTVAPNDSCWDIATANGLTMDQLVALNPGLNCSTIAAGQFLCLPSCSSTYTVAAGDSCFSVAAAYGTTLAQLESLNPNLNCSLVYPGQLVCVAFSQTPLSLAPSSPTIGGSGSGSSSSSSSAVAVGVGIGVGVGGLLILLLAGFLVWKHRRRTQSATASTGKPAAGTGSPDTMQIDAAAADSNLQHAADDVVLEMASVPDKAPRYPSSLGDSALSIRVAAAQTASQMLKRVTSDATKGQIISKLGDLSYIEWDQVTGVGGPGTAMEFLCQGGYGVIYKGRWQDEVVVLKKMEANGGDIRGAQEELAREAYIMASCTNPNIAQIYGITLEPGTGTPALVMRYYSKGSLRTVLDERPDLDLATRLRMAREIAWGMRYLHARHHEMIVHGDLKTTNLLCDETLRVHISDFGLASMKTVTRTMMPTSGARTVVFAAPEILQGVGVSAIAKRSIEADVYAFAMVLFELFTGACPFSGANEGQIVGVVLNGLRPTIPVMEIGASSEGTTGHVPVPVAHLMERCWAQDPMFRPGFDQVVVALEAAAAALNLDINNESE